jgi:hypothetical protein
MIVLFFKALAASRSSALLAEDEDIINHQSLSDIVFKLIKLFFL